MQESIQIYACRIDVINEADKEGKWSSRLGKVFFYKEKTGVVAETLKAKRISGGRVDN